MTDVQENETASDELRVCPMRDAICPHGMDCPYTDGYNCKPGWNTRIALPTADGAQQPVTHSEQLRNSLQSVADELSKRPAELRGPFTMPTHQDAKREFEVMVAGPDGWSDWLRPVGDKYRMKCCDCGLVHNMEFRIDGNENINFRMSRGDTHPAPAPGPAVAAASALAAYQAKVGELEDLARQFKSDLASAHAEICKLQGLDPATHTWPEWSPQANTLRWIEEVLLR